MTACDERDTETGSHDRGVPMSQWILVQDTSMVRKVTLSGFIQYLEIFYASKDSDKIIVSYLVRQMESDRY